jgi:hypothetical protein
MVRVLPSAVVWFLSLSCLPIRSRGAPPTQLNGDYTFACDSDTATLKLSGLALSSGNQNAAGNPETVPIYCGPQPGSGPAWDAYQQRLDTAEADFEAGCNDLVSNLGLPARPQECKDAAADWRAGLEEINDNVAGLAPASLSIEVLPGDAGNELLGIWPMTRNGPLCYC